MKAVVIDQYGGPEVLKFADHPDPVVGAGEVLIRVSAASVNPVDTFERAGATKDWRPIKFPGVLGWDVSGTILEVGPGVESFAAGEKVFAWAYHTYAEFCVVKAELLAKVPEGLDLEAAAALPLVTATGGQLISVGSGLKAGQRVLVSGAFGGVGRSAIFAAKDLGAFVIAGVRRKQIEEAEDLGADQVVALDDEDAMGRLEPVDVVANAVRGTTAELLLAKVKQGGVFASATGAPQTAKDHPTVRVVPFVSKQDAKSIRYMADAVASGKLKIPIGLTLHLKDAAVGHRAMEKGGIGKVLLVV